MTFAGSDRRQPRRSPSLEVSQVESANLAERRHVYLGVGTGCQRTAVSQMITDLLERQTGGEQARRAGMAKGVPAPVSGFDSEGDKSTVSDTIDASRLHRPAGCVHAEKDFWTG